MKVLKNNNENNDKEKYNSSLVVDKKTREDLDKRALMFLFEVLHKQERITRKEYDNLISKLHRTHSLDK